MCFENATPRTADVGLYEAPPPIFKEVNYYEMSVSFPVEGDEVILELFLEKSPGSKKSSTAEGSLQKCGEF